LIRDVLDGVLLRPSVFLHYSRSPQQQAFDPNATLDLLTKALGPTLAQAVAVATNLQKAEQHLQQHHRQQEQIVTRQAQSDPIQQHIQALAANFKQVEQQQKLRFETLSSGAQTENQTRSLTCESSAITGKKDQNGPSVQPSALQQQDFSFPQLLPTGQLQNHGTSTTCSTLSAPVPTNVVMNQIQAYQLQLQQMYLQIQNQHVASKTAPSNPLPINPPPSNAQAPSVDVQQKRENPLLAHQQLQSIQPSTQIPAISTDQQAKDFAIRLKEVYEQHVQKQQCVADSSANTAHQVPTAIPLMQQSFEQHLSSQANTIVADTGNRQLSNLSDFSLMNSAKSRGAVENTVSVSTMPCVTEESTGTDGGNALVGFLSSLRQSYEEALRDQQQATFSQNGESRQEVKKEESTASTKNEGITASRLSELAAFIALATGNQGRDKEPNSSNRATATTITDSASSTQNQVESSVEDYSDWNSDKKTDPSSSEDSDKEQKESTNYNASRHNNSGRGPPRKRMKASNN
jgi:hypothetical protein